MTIEDILNRCRTVAIVGLSPKPDRPSHRVAAYLKDHGYRVVPVHPSASSPILGEPVYPSLDAIPFPVEVVTVFRKPETVVPLAAEAVRVGAKVLWLQEGIVNREAARVALEGGLEVVMDRCMLKEHRKLVNP